MRARRARGLLVSLLLLGFVLPPDRVLRELVRLRRALPPIHLEALLAGVGSGWPEHVVLDLHPDLGLRVQDDAGGRWLVRGGRLLAGSSARLPLWMPPLEILVLRRTEAILLWLQQAGIDPSGSVLARCGDADCLVLGGSGLPGQLWLDKDRFEVVRVLLPGGRRIELRAYRDWGGVRFPSEIAILEGQAPIATLSLRAVSAAPGLGAGDFSTHWVAAPRAAAQ